MTEPRELDGLDYMPLSFRALGALRGEGLITGYAIAAASDQELLSIKNFGRISLREVREAVREVLYLCPEPPPAARHTFAPTGSRPALAKEFKRKLKLKEPWRTGDDKCPPEGDELSSLELNFRAERILRENGLTTIDAINGTTNCVLKSLNDFGPHALAEVRLAVARAMSDRPDPRIEAMAREWCQIVGMDPDAWAGCHLLMERLLKVADQATPAPAMGMLG